MTVREPKSGEAWQPWSPRICSECNQPIRKSLTGGIFERGDLSQPLGTSRHWPGDCPVKEEKVA